MMRIDNSENEQHLTLSNFDGNKAECERKKCLKHGESIQRDKKMSDNEPGTQTDSTLGYTFQNDFLALSQAFSLPEFDYTDISQREQLTAAIKRWPLLAEFAQQQ